MVCSFDPILCNSVDSIKNGYRSPIPAHALIAARSVGVRNK